MEQQPDDVRAAALRLKRARGHLDHVIAMLEDGSNCQDVLTQLAAVSKAINRGAYSIVTTGLEKCVDGNGRLDAAQAKALEKLFMSLA
jgi:DNA-binding FrmR family transcriptional regulator